MPKIPIRPIRIEGNVAYVPLTQGYEAIIDADKAALAQPFNWCAARGGRTFYAMTNRARPARGSFTLHRLITGFHKTLSVDHINGDGLDNRVENLRLVTHAQNCMNRAMRCDNKTGLKGVWFHKHRKKWEAEIVAQGQRNHLGYFDSAEDAHAAYVSAAMRLHGEYMRI